MRPSYPVDSIECLFPLIHRRIRRALEDLSALPAIQQSASRLVHMLPEESAILSVPLLVYATETGNPGQAVPISAIHALWWTAAHIFDDYIDHGDTAYPCQASSGDPLMAAVACGLSLPALIAVDDFPHTVLPQMIREFSYAWLISNNGQIRDLNTDRSLTGPQAILLTYQQKTGAAYGAASAMAASLSGCSHARRAQWTDFGQALGLLGQFRNDQEDLVSGRDEDLKNGTATFLLHCLLESVSDAPRRHVLSLLTQARLSPDSRSELKQLMLMPDVVEAYSRQIDILRCSALRKLDLLCPDNGYGQMLCELVEQAATRLPSFSSAVRHPNQQDVVGAPNG